GPPESRGDPPAIRAERHALDARLQAPTREDLFARCRIPYGQLTLSGLSVESASGPGGDQLAIGAEGHAPGADTLVPAVGEQIEVASPLDIVPLPAAQGGRAFLQEAIGSGDAVCLPFAVGSVDAADGKLPFQRLCALDGFPRPGDGDVALPHGQVALLLG